MTDQNHIDIIKSTVRLLCTTTNNYIGTGVIYYKESLNNQCYVLTASHNLHKDENSLTEMRKEIQLDFFDYSRRIFVSKIQVVNPNLVSNDILKDIAIIVVENDGIDEIVKNLPSFEILKVRNDLVNFVVKGYANATNSEELIDLKPTFIQPLSSNERFQLQLIEEYSKYNLQGLSGSGIFTVINDNLYLYGILTRFTDEEKGEIFYCEYSTTLNEILQSNFKPELEIGFVDSLGINFEFFIKNVNEARVALGPRFREELNFKLPIASLFNDIVKDNIFYKRFLSRIDKWVLERDSYHSNIFPSIGKLSEEIKCVKQKTIDWANKISSSLEIKIELDWLDLELEKIDKQADQLRNELYKLQSDEIAKSDTKEKINRYNRPFEHEIDNVFRIQRDAQNFRNSLFEEICVPLANNPILILDGDAGNGKSHLLGDISTDRIKKRLPTLLLLGQKFTRQGDIWKNILEELELNCNKTEFLKSLNNIGKQIGSRVLILIDAINEGNGKELWECRLANFINDFNIYPFIAIVLTVRTTYKNYIILPEIQKDKNITFKTHYGFMGSEYEALKQFCFHYKLEQPSFPIMSPEYTNPLFLHLICEALKTNGEKLFPKGSQGINRIYQLYVSSLQDKFSRKDQYKNKPKLIIDAISKFSEKTFETELRSLTLDEANKLFDSEFAMFGTLLTDLIEESILIKNVSFDYVEKVQREFVYFAFQRFGDYYIAKLLLSKYDSKAELLEAFKEQNVLGKLTDSYYWKYQGVLEAFSTLLPELFQLELFEVYDWFYNNHNYYLNEFVLNSITWRSIDCIVEPKISKWLNENYSRTNDFDSCLLTLTKITSIQNHSFNSDRLFEILKKFKLPERDSFWQNHVRCFSGLDDSNNAFPLQRLIDWAWSSDVSNKTDTETARLTGQTLAWVLASTNIKLRDETTKALVNLLEQQIDALIDILKAFKNIDDMFIYERLYAVAYGCILRTQNVEDIVKLAQFVYNTIFKNGIVPNHILLRDYARNCVEFAIYKNTKLKIDERRIRPPYKSIMPKVFPTLESLEKYKLPIKDEDEYDDTYARMNNRICFDVIEWDFGRKEVEPNLRHFEVSKFTFKEDLKLFKRSCNSELKKILNNITGNIELKSTIKNNKFNLTRLLGKELFEKELDDVEKFQIHFTDKFKSLDVEKFQFVENEIVPFYEDKFSNNNYTSEFNTKPILCWIADRAFKLGYNSKIHGLYDESIDRHYWNRNGSYFKIGEKYSRIAYYEILAVIADNYKIKKGWREDGKSNFYKGTWQLYIRDINPSFVTKTIKADDDNDLGLINIYSNWWNNIDYKYWNQGLSEWIKNIDDMPKPEFLINKIDDLGNSWLILKTFKEWREPKKIGQEKYGSHLKNIWYKINSYLVKKSQKERITSWLLKQNFWGNSLPESREDGNLFNREKYWSPAYIDSYSEKLWSKLDESKFTVMITTSEATGSISDDKSDAHIGYDMPSKFIFEGMELNYASTDGEFKLSNNDIVVINKDFEGCMIKKDLFLKFLEDNQLEIIWTVLGEKSAFANLSKENYFQTYSGVYYLQDNKIVGELNSFERE